MSNLVKVQLNPERFLKLDLFLIEYPGLSGLAKWVYAYIASRPPGWKIYATEIAKHCTEGADRVSGALAELQEACLLVIDQERDIKTNRFAGKVWRLLGFDKPKSKRVQTLLPSGPSRNPDFRITDPRNTGKGPLLRSRSSDLNLRFILSPEPPTALPPLPTSDPERLAAQREKAIFRRRGKRHHRPSRLCPQQERHRPAHCPQTRLPGCSVWLNWSRGTQSACRSVSRPKPG